MGVRGDRVPIFWLVHQLPKNQGWAEAEAASQGLSWVTRIPPLDLSPLTCKVCSSGS